MLTDGIDMHEATLRAKVKAQEATIKEQEIIIKLLREKVDLLVRKVFGKSSEALDEQQLMLMLQGDDAGKKRPGLRGRRLCLGG